MCARRVIHSPVEKFESPVIHRFIPSLESYPQVYPQVYPHIHRLIHSPVEKVIHTLWKSCGQSRQLSTGYPHPVDM